MHPELEKCWLSFCKPEKFQGFVLYFFPLFLQSTQCDSKGPNFFKLYSFAQLVCYTQYKESLSISTLFS